MAAAGEQAFLADPGALMSGTHEVGDGLRVRLRLARPSDTARVRTFLEGLSEETRHRRFLSAMPRVPEHMVRHFTYFDPRRRQVVAAVLPQDGTELIVGLADIALDAGTSVAELAVVVDDSLQSHGVGSLLTEVVASLALRRGATHLRAELLEENRPMIRLTERLGRTVRTVDGATSEVYTRLSSEARRAA